jgi:hypothetical protein
MNAYDESTRSNIQQYGCFILQALYPVPFLFSGSLRFQAQTEEIRKYHQHFPQLAVQDIWDNNGQRRVHLKLSLGYELYFNAYL